MLTVVGAGGIVFAFGLLDDIVHLHPAAKLGAQLVAAYLVLHSTISVEFVSNQTLAWAIGILWLVGLTNAFNLLDNMDGLAGSLGVVAASCFALSAAFVDPNRDIFIIATALALGLLGFIPYNLRPSGPARVFMGDSGSQLIGFVLASLGLMASYKEAGTTIATVALAGADPRRPDPRHHPRHRAAAALRPLGDRGRARPHLAPARLPRALRAARGPVPRRRLGRARSDEPRVRGARQRPHHDDRRARHVRAAAAVRGIPLRRRRRAGRERPLGTRQPARRHARRRGADRGVVLRGLRDRGQRQRHRVAAPHLHLGTPRRAALPLHRPLGVRSLPARSERRQARYPDADCGGGGAVGARRLLLRDQDADTPRVPREDLRARRGDLLRLPRRRPVRRAGRATGCSAPGAGAEAP